MPLVKTQRRIVLCALRSVVATLFICTLGCSRNAPDRASIHGFITVNGQPLELGSIMFVPSGTTRGPTSGGSIRNGMYSISQVHGPVVGDMNVRFSAPKLNPGVPAPTGNNEIFRLMTQSEEMLPSHYNSKSTIHYTTKPGDNEFNYDIELKSAVPSDSVK